MIEQIKEALEKATSGNWIVQPGDSYDAVYSSQKTRLTVVAGRVDHNDAYLLANTPTYIRYLLDELEKVQKEIEKRDHVLKNCLNFVEPQVEHHGYGFFPGGNPNLFFPDAEMNSPQEIENWNEACKRWDEGNTEGEPSSHVPLIIGNEVIGSATIARLGMGSYVDVDEDAKTLLDSILSTLSNKEDTTCTDSTSTEKES